MTATLLLASCRIADQPASPLPGMALAVQTTQLLLSLGCAAPRMSFGLSCTESRTRIDGNAFCKPRGAGERKGKGSCIACRRKAGCGRRNACSLLSFAIVGWIMKLSFRCANDLCHAGWSTIVDQSGMTMTFCMHVVLLRTFTTAHNRNEALRQTAGIIANAVGCRTASVCC
jgi:hypothetical protein